MQPIISAGLDAALAYYVLDRPDIIMVVAEKYEKYAFFRWLVRITNGMFIDRFNADIKAIRETLRRLQQGQILTITPEGTRSKSGNLIEAKPGGIYLAWKAGVPILPVAITGTEDAVVKDRLGILNVWISGCCRAFVHFTACRRDGPGRPDAAVHR